MGSGIKLALVAIFGLPALLLGFKYTLLGAYRGIVLRRVPMGEEESDAAIGFAALAIGIYAALMAGLMLTGCTYIVVWLFAK
jgi:hypothetical protein